MFISEIGLALLLSQPGPTVEQVRTETRSMLQSMCGQQCDVIDVKIKRTTAAPAGATAPGFDDAPRARMVASQVKLTLLFDSKLDRAYRKFVADRVKQRVSENGLPVLIEQQVRAFPAPPPDPRPPPTTPPAPMIIQQPAPAPPPPQAPAPEPKVDLLERFLLRMIEALPLLLIFGLLAWLVLRVLRRMENLAFDTRAPLPEEEPSVTLTPELVEESVPPTQTALPPPTSDALGSDLRLHRGSTRRIFKRLLLAGQHDTVAKGVALLGDFVVRDLVHDPEVRRALKAAGERTSQILRAPITEEDQAELLRDVQAELISDRVAHGADDVRAEFLELLAWGPEAFASLMGRLDQRLQLLMLRHAPAHLSESYLKGFSAERRTEIVRSLLDAPAAEPEEIDALARSIQEQSRAALVGGYEADHLVDLIDSLPAGEQDAVVSTLETTRPDYVRRNLGQLPVESALLRVPDEALDVAWGTVSLEDWVAYLRVAPPGIRTRALGTCPKRLRASVEDELSLRVAPDQARAVAARRRIVQAALDAERSTSALAVVDPSKAPN